MGEDIFWSLQQLGLGTGMPNLVLAVLIANVSSFLCTSLSVHCLLIMFKQQSLLLCILTAPNNVFLSVITAPKCYGNTVNEL